MIESIRHPAKYLSQNLRPGVTITCDSQLAEITFTSSCDILLYFTTFLQHVYGSFMPYNRSGSKKQFGSLSLDNKNMVYVYRYRHISHKCMKLIMCRSFMIRVVISYNIALNNIYFS